MDEVKVQQRPRIPDPALSPDGRAVPLLLEPSFDPLVPFKENVSFPFVAFWTLVGRQNQPEAACLTQEGFTKFQMHTD